MSTHIQFLQYCYETCLVVNELQTVVWKNIFFSRANNYHLDSHNLAVYVPLFSVQTIFEDRAYIWISINENLGLFSQILLTPFQSFQQHICLLLSKCILTMILLKYLSQY